MLKERDARFLPQALTEQHRRVHRDCQHRRRDSLCDVVMIDKFFSVALEVDLETGVARFHHDVVVRQVKLVEALDMNREWTTTETNHTTTEFVIARDRSEIVER